MDFCCVCIDFSQSNERMSISLYHKTVFTAIKAMIKTRRFQLLEDFMSCHQATNIAKEVSLYPLQMGSFLNDSDCN